MTRTAVITGGGSGVGRAIALRLAAEDWRVAILGRRRASLDETASLATAGAIQPAPCDIVDAAAVAAVRDGLRATWDGVDAVINAAGVNIVRRGVDLLSVDDFRRVVEINLLGAFHVVHAFLPMMRGRERATVVNIGSDAGLIANAKAGASYVAAKFGLTGLTDSLNTELRGQGIRVCAVCPGDIDTALLDQRPVKPDAAARAAMLQPDDVADCVLLALTLPHRAVLERLVVRPRY